MPSIPQNMLKKIQRSRDCLQDSLVTHVACLGTQVVRFGSQHLTNEAVRRAWTDAAVQLGIPLEKALVLYTFQWFASRLLATSSHLQSAGGLEPPR